MRLAAIANLVGVLSLTGCDGVTAPSVTRPSGAATQAQANIGSAELHGRLASGRWIRELGAGPGREQYVYSFAADGTYTSKLLTDHGTPTVTGRWELARGDDGLSHLRLSDQQGQKDYYWLGQDSIVRIDEETGDLLVSGPRYVGEQRLRHER